MYAIIRTGGHQEKVTPGEVITVDRRKEAEGATVEFTPLMISTEDGQVISDKAALTDGGALVVGTIVKHVKADKVDVFMYRNKTGYRRNTGHRQPISVLEISEIRFGGKVVKAPEPAPEPEPTAEPADKPAAKKKAAKKPAAKKKASAKKAAAKKKTTASG